MASVVISCDKQSWQAGVKAGLIGWSGLCCFTLCVSFDLCEAFWLSASQFHAVSISNIIVH